MPHSDAITQLVEQRRDELLRQDTALAAQEAGVRSRREQIAGELNRLDIAVEVYRTFERHGKADIITDDTLVEAATNGAGLAMEGMTIAEAAAAYLQSIGGTGRAKPILEALVAAGRIKPSPHSMSTLSKTLAQSDRFEKVTRGLWKVREREPIERP